MIASIAIKNILHRPLQALLSWVLLTASVAIISLLVLLQAQFQQKFEASIQGIDLVMGAKGSPLQLILKGYIIPLDVGLYALSKNPYAACFFCGGAGPETITGLTFAKTPKRYKTDELLTLQGVFKLNSENVDKFMYQLYAVEAVK